MSRIGNRILAVPNTISVEINTNNVVLKNSTSSLVVNYPSNLLKIEFSDNNLKVNILNSSAEANMFQGTVNANLNNITDTKYPDFPLEEVFSKLYKNKNVIPSKELIIDTAHFFRTSSIKYIKLY